MVAVVSGNGLGLGNSSLKSLGLAGALGSASEGRAGEQVYINSTTGDLVIQDGDDFIAALGLDLPLTRTYNSQGQLSDDFGGTWRMGANERLISLTGTVNTAGSTIVKVFGDEAQITFTYDASRGKYIATGEAGAEDELAFNAATQQWTWTEGSTRNTETYDSTGRLLSAHDIDGNTRSYTYTGSLLTQITDASGQSTFLDYTGSNLTQIRVVSQGLTQTVTHYGYDGQNRLQTVTLDLSPKDNSTADGQAFTTTYGYDGTSNRVASITRTGGSSIGFTYVQAGTSFRVSSYTTSLGTTSLTYTNTAGGGIQTQITDPLGQVTTLIHDAQGRLIDEQVQTANGLVETQFQYDSHGNVTRTTRDPAGRASVTDFEYDTHGSLTLTRDADGDTVTRTFSSTNQILTETSYVTPDPDGSGAAQPSVPLTTRYAYDTEGHLRFVASADGRVTEYRYDAAGNRTSMIEYPGGEIDVSTLSANTALTEAQLVSWVATQDLTKLKRTDYTYDFRGQVSTAIAYATTNSSGVGIAAGASTTQYVYDQRGLLLQTVDPRGAATAANPSNANIPYSMTYVYDGLGRVTSQTVWTAAGTASTTTTQYNDAGNSTSVTLANGLVTTSTFNGENELISVTNTGPGSQALGTTTYSYDVGGRLRMVTDPIGNRSYKLYDAAGRKVADIDSDGDLTEYVYDNENNLVETIGYGTALSASTLATLVDSSGNPTNVSLATLKGTIGRQTAPNTSTDRVSINVYDDAGRLFQIVDGAGGVKEYVYDGLGRVTREIQYANAVFVPATTDPTALRNIAVSANHFKDRNTFHFYDGDSHLTGTVDANSYLTEYVYDGAGQLTTQIQWAFQANEGDTLDEVRPEPMLSNDIYTRYFYDGEGRKVGVLDSEGYLTETLYDTAGNVSQQIRYDSQLSYSDGATVGSLRPTGVATHATSYQYDGANRVVQQTNYEGTVQTFTYDSVGNLTSSTLAQGTSDARTSQTRYDALGRVIAQLTPEGSSLITAGMTQAQIDAIWNQYSVRFSYDLAGRRTSSTDQDGRQVLYFYDAEGRVRYTVDAAGDVTEQRYDSRGDVTDQIAYAKPIVVTGLTGGVISSLLNSQLASAADPTKDSHTTLTYTVLGQLASTTTAEGSSTSYQYNAFGDLTTKLVAQSLLPTEYDYTYDFLGQLTTEVDDSRTINKFTFYSYDAFGRINSTNVQDGISGAFRGTSSDYDRLGRVIRTYDSFFNQTSTTYDGFSRVLTSQDRAGDTTTYSYDDDGRKVTVTSAEGVVTTTIHNREGQVASVSTGANTTSYTYDANGVEKTVTDDLGILKSCTYDPAGLLTSDTDANGIVTSYTYDSAGRIKTKTVDSAPGGLNLVTTYTYDGEGRVTQVDEPGGKSTVTKYDRDGRIVQVDVDPQHLDLRTTYAYDVAGNLITLVEGAGSSNPRITQYGYDALGRRTSEDVDPAVEGSSELHLHLITSYYYDAFGNVTRKQNADGYSTWYVYDSNNRLIQTIDTLGGVTENTYDADDRLLSTRRYATAMDILPLESVDQPSQQFLNTSDADRVEQTVYDRDGRAVYSIDGTGTVTQRTFDENGNVIRTWTLSAQVAPGMYQTIDDVQAAISAVRFGDVTDVFSTDRVSYSAYDARGRAIFTVDSRGDVIQNFYDGNGNLTATTAYATQYTGSAFDADSLQSWADSHFAVAFDRTTLYFYDGLGRVRFAQDPNGLLTETRYDDTNRTQTTLGAVQASMTRFATIADAEAAMQTATYPLHTTITQYDVAGRVSQVTDAAGGTEKYTYDALGHKLTFTNQNNATWHYHYDAAGRLKEEDSPPVLASSTFAGTTIGISSSGVASIATTYTYDAVGNVLTRTEAAGSPSAVTTSYDYDGLGRQIRVHLPSVGVYNFSGDNVNAIGNSVTRHETTPALYTEVTYDTLGNAIQSRDVNGVYSFKMYDAEGRVQFEVDAGNYITGYVYDAFGDRTQVTRYATPLSAAITPGSQFTSSDLQLRIHASPTTDRTITTDYDTLGHILTVTEPATYTFEPDTQANDAVFVASEITRSQYNAFGEVVASTRDVGNGKAATTYSYFDRDGRLIAQVDPMGYGTTYDHDVFGNVTTQTEYAKTAFVSGTDFLPTFRTTTSANSPNDPAGYDRVTVFQYDALNRKTSESLQNFEYYDDNLTRTTGSRTTTYDYDAVGNQVRVTQPNGATTYTFYDALGRVIGTAGPQRNLTGTTGFEDEERAYTEILRDALGNVVEEIDHDIGAVIPSDWTPSSPPPVPPASPNGSDRTTLYYRDALGRAIQTQDPTGVQTYDSYTATGQLAKEWQYVTDNDGFVGTIMQIHQYDALGRETDLIESQVSGSVAIDTRSRYDSFGDVDAKSVFQYGTNPNPAWQELFSYDQAGHMWRSNSNGVWKIYFYNLAGQVTYTMTSRSIDLSQYASAAAADAGVSDRTHQVTVYDLDGRIVQQRETNIALLPPTFDPSTTQTLDRWGNAITMVDRAGKTTTYRYNMLNQLTQTTLPQVTIFDTSNVVTDGMGTPVTHNLYDLMGNMLQAQDGNGHGTRYFYNAVGQVLVKEDADSDTYSATGGAFTRYTYNQFGDVLQVIDQLGFRTRNQYDKDSRLTRVDQEIDPDTFLDNDPHDPTIKPHRDLSVATTLYQYDQAGRRKTVTDATGATTKYWYDLQGNVSQMRTAMNFLTMYSYNVRNQKIQEIDPESSIQTWHYTDLGVLDHHTDKTTTGGADYGTLSGTSYTYTYDKAGHLQEQTNTLGQDLNYTYDIDGRLTEIFDNGTAASSLVQSSNVDTSYTYDTSDRVVEEIVYVDNKEQEDTITNYDALGRIESTRDLNDYQLTYAYDAAGNRTIIEAAYDDHNGNLQNQTLYFTYDAANHVLISDGIETTGAAPKVTIDATHGQRLTYDAKGQRATAQSGGQKMIVTAVVQNGSQVGRSVGAQTTSDGLATQQYTYDGLGRLGSVGQQADFYTLDEDANTTTFNQSGYQATSTKTYDKASHVLTESNFTPASGVTTTGMNDVETVSDYDADGRVMHQTTYKNNVIQALVTYGESNHNNGSWTLGYDAADVLRAYSVQFFSNGTAQYTTTHKLSYQLGSSYVETREAVSSTGTNAPGPGGANRKYNVNGALVQQSDDNLPNNTRYLANDDTGHVLAAIQGNFSTPASLSAAWDEALARTAGNSVKAEYFFWSNGNYLGSFGQLQSSDGSFTANFDVNYTPVSQGYPADTPANVVVQSGDTLRTIAARVFGDAGLWYLIAQANGLTDPNSAPAAGTTLIIPNKVVSLSNTADSFKPFDLSQAISNTSPYQPPPPPQHSGCGVFGQILEIAVAIVVAYFTAGALSGLAPAIAGAIGGVAGSVASQAVAIADGDQKGFNWKGVAIGAIAGAVGGELGASGFGKAVGGELQLTGDALKYGASAINAAAGSVLTQGIGVVTGLQQQFSWSSVAAAAIAAPLVQAVDSHLGINTNPDTNSYTDRFQASLVSTVTNGLVGAATQLAIDGKVQTVNLEANAFGQILGNSFVSLDTRTPNISVNAEQQQGAFDQIAQGAAETAADVDARVASDNSRYFEFAQKADAAAMLGIQQSADTLNADLAQSMASLSRLPQINFPDEAPPIDPIVAAEYAARGDRTFNFVGATVDGLPRSDLQSAATNAPYSFFGTYAQAKLTGTPMDQFIANRLARETPDNFPATGTIRGLSDFEATLEFNPVARGLLGFGVGLAEIVRTPANLSDGLTNALRDAYGFAKDEIFGVAPGEQPYQAKNGIISLFQQEGTQAVGDLIGGTVRSLPVFSTLSAGNDPFDIARSLPGTLSVLGGAAFAPGRVTGGNGPSIVLDLFGGKTSQVPGAVNVDIIAQGGVRASALQLPFRDASANQVIASNPYIPGGAGMMDYLPEASRVLQQGGQLIINSTAGNKFGRLPDAQTLQGLGLTVIQDRGPLLPQFRNNVFRRTDGSSMPPNSMRTTILQKTGGT